MIPSPNRGGPLKKTDIGEPTEFRHVAGFAFDVRASQNSSPVNVAEPMSDADVVIYEDVDMTPATPSNTPTTPSPLAHPTPAKRRVAPPPPGSGKKLAPPVMAKPGRHQSSTTHTDSSSTNGITRGTKTRNMLPTGQDEKMTSLFKLASIALLKDIGDDSKSIKPIERESLPENAASDKILDTLTIDNEIDVATSHGNSQSVQKDSATSPPKTNPSEGDDLQLKLNPKEDESVYENVEFETKGLQLLEQPVAVNEEALAVKEDHFDAPPPLLPLPGEIVPVKKRYPIGRSPSTVAALSVLDSVINCYSELIEEEEEYEEVVNGEAINIESQVKPDDLDSKVTQNLTIIIPPIPKPRSIVTSDSLSSQIDVDEGEKDGEVHVTAAAEQQAECSSTASSVTSSTRGNNSSLTSLDDIDDPALRLLLRKAGVTDIELKDPTTRDFIFQFILEHGGEEAVKKESLFLDKFKTVAVRRPKKKRHTAVRVVSIDIDCDDDDDESAGTYL